MSSFKEFLDYRDTFMCCILMTCQYFLKLFKKYQTFGTDFTTWSLERKVQGKGTSSIQKRSIMFRKVIR